jgi:hypothetical protein
MNTSDPNASDYTDTFSAAEVKDTMVSAVAIVFAGVLLFVVA